MGSTLSHFLWQLANFYIFSSIVSFFQIWGSFNILDHYFISLKNWPTCYKLPWMLAWKSLASTFVWEGTPNSSNVPYYAINSLNACQRKWGQLGGISILKFSWMSNLTKTINFINLHLTISLYYSPWKEANFFGFSLILQLFKKFTPFHWTWMCDI